MKTTTLVTLCTLALTVGVATAGDEAGREEGKQRTRPEGKERGERPGGEAFKAFMKSQKEAGRAHHKAQGEETKALLETLREGEPQAGCVAMAAHRTTQQGENQAFMTTQNETIVAFMTEHAAENEIPAEKLAEHLEQMQKHQAERTKRHEEMSQALIAKLTELSAKEDLTWEEVKKTMKPMHRRGKRGGKRGGEGGGEGKGEHKREREHKRGGEQDND